MAKNLFTHLSISKRVRYRVTAETRHLVASLNLFFNFYEYEMLPLRRVLDRRFVGAWLPRWRELFVYTHIGANLLLRRGFDASRHLDVSHIPTTDT